jgi:hypothetical protein
MRRKDGATGFTLHSDCFGHEKHGYSAFQRCGMERSLHAACLSCFLFLLFGFDLKFVDLAARLFEAALFNVVYAEAFEYQDLMSWRMYTSSVGRLDGLTEIYADWTVLMGQVKSHFGLMNIVCA